MIHTYKKQNKIIPKKKSNKAKSIQESQERHMTQIWEIIKHMNPNQNGMGKIKISGNYKPRPLPQLERQENDSHT